MIKGCDMDLMNLAARLTLDMKDYEDSIGKATQSAQSFSKNLGGASGKVGGAIKTVAKAGAVAIGAGAAAVGFLTKQAVDGYAQYEQLSGGVKKLFGDAADDVGPLDISLLKSDQYLISDLRQEVDALEDDVAAIQAGFSDPDGDGNIVISFISE